MTRMIVAVPSEPRPNDRLCSRLYLTDGTMLDFALDQRCATCANWKRLLGGAGSCTKLGIVLHEDFGCTKWEPRDDAG
jgi:hypothetical protein